MKKYKYRTYMSRLTEEKLNELGAEGWELVSHNTVLIRDLEHYYIFKKNY